VILKRAADFERLLTAPPSGLRAAVIHGRDRSGVRERGRALALAVGTTPGDPFDTAELGDSDLERDPARLSDELSALSLLGGRRMVTVRLSGERIGAERLAAETLKLHVDGALNPEAFLLIEAGALGGNSALRRVAETSDRVAVVPVYEDADADLVQIAREALAKDGIRLSPEALTLFASRLPKERGVARSEIERLALFIGPGSRATVTPDDLAPFLGVEADASLSEAAEHAFGGRLGPSLDQLRRAFNEGEVGTAAVRAAGSYGQRLRRIGSATRSGATLAATLKSAGVFWKNEREITRQVRAWPDTDLLAIQARVLEADAQCKSAGSPDLILAERLYLSIAAMARRAGL
jgi:DNA polymerase-3 subunit delta